MTSTTAVLAGAITLLTLFRPGLCEEYRWSGPVSGAIIAPTDSNGYEITGASLQGGLVDLRYGQASIDTGGTGIVLDWNDETVFTLNGKTSDPASLTNLVNEGSGLTVAVRYDPSSGLMGWCDAVDGVSSVPAVNLTLEPWKPILTPGERLTIKLDRSEAERLGLKNPTLFVPGMTHGIAFRLTDARFWSAELPIKTGWNWKGLPLFVTAKTESP